MASSAAAAAVPKEEASREKGAAKGTGSSLGPILALLVVIGLGVGIAWFAKNALTPDLDEANDEQVEAKRVVDKGPIWNNQVPIDLGEILANVKNEHGRRYVKAEVQIWVRKVDQQLINRPEVLPSLKAEVQRSLRGWDIGEYEQESMADKMEHQFTEGLDKVLRDLLGESDPEVKYVQRVVHHYLVQ